MDKNAIKKYAIWARRELIARVSQRAALYEITADAAYRITENDQPRKRFSTNFVVSLHQIMLSEKELCKFRFVMRRYLYVCFSDHSKRISEPLKRTINSTKFV